MESEITKDGARTLAQYTYNASGYRTSKTVNGVTTEHVLDGANVAADVVGGQVTQYVRGLGLTALVQADGTRLQYVTDGHGDVKKLISGSGAVVADYTYDAFGNQTEEAEDSNPFRYSGEYYDKETGLIYLRARYYDAGIGSFTQEDPARDGENWYSYCGGNPVNFWDPLGLARWIRDLVSETTGSIGWNMFTNTATVEVDGKKQEYVVGSDYWVRVNGNIVGYLENDKIMIEEYDFDRDFDIAGRLMVYSYYNANDEWIQSAYGSSPPLGHSWIRYQTIHGGTVDVSLPNGQSVRGVSEFRVSTWNNGDSTALNRNWDRDHENDSHTIVSSRKITKNQQQKLLNDISTRSVHWTVINNCHVYARAVYYTVTGKLF